MATTKITIDVTITHDDTVTRAEALEAWWANQKASEGSGCRCAFTLDEHEVTWTSDDHVRPDGSYDDTQAEAATVTR